MKKQIPIKGNHLAASLIALSIFSMMMASVQVTYAQQGEEQVAVTTDEIPEGSVAVAEGSNATVQYYTYTPQTIEINVGDNVTWYNQAELSDIHTVTFFMDESVMSDIILPFAVSGETDFELLPPFNVGEPVIIPTPDGREAIVALNKEAFYPSIVGANNQTTYLNETDIQYTINGTERVINSGIILPPLPPIDEETTPQATEEGQPLAFEPPFPLVNSFTVTFEEPGTYPYICAIHPWMGGEVIVQGQ